MIGGLPTASSRAVPLMTYTSSVSLPVVRATANLSSIAMDDHSDRGPWPQISSTVTWVTTPGGTSRIGYLAPGPM